MSTASDPALATLVVNFNSGSALRRCLEALRASDAGDCPVVIVDNASTDGSLEGLERAFSPLCIERLAQNRGFAGGVNAGLARLLGAAASGSTRPRRILLLNPDTEVAPDFLAPLERALDEGASLAGPRLLLPGLPRRLWCAGGMATFGLNLSRLRGHGEEDRGQFGRPEDVSFLPGTVWLLEAQVLERVGALDEGFFCYLEDLDYCLRMTAAGLRLRYEPRSRVVHEGSRSSGGGYTPLRKYLNAWGSWRLMRKHGTAVRWCKFLTCDVATLPFLLMATLASGRRRGALWKARGLWDGLLGRAVTAQRLGELLGAGGVP